MPLPFPFDWKNPDYNQVFEWRVERLNRIRSTKDKAVVLKAMGTYYRDHPGQFIIDWGMTLDPRNVERHLPTALPFLLYPRQEEWCEWFLQRWRCSEPGITEKSREMGLSWLTVGISCTLCNFIDGVAAGFGSRKEEYVDKIGAPKSLFEKARFFMQSLPPEFRRGWNASKHAPHMRILFPDTGSFIGGESGDEIGRGDRTSFYFVDEAAFLEHPETVDGALSQTTNCRIDVSTPNGMANTFAQKRHSKVFAGTNKLFTFHWRDDPRKGEAWYAKQKAELDPVIIAAEVDIDYSASVEGQVIPSAWVQAAIGAAQKLGLEVTGRTFAGLDVADEGKDDNCMAGRRGVELNRLKSWSGKGLSIYKTTVRAFDLCEEWGHERFDYDADGLGAGVRGDAERLNEDRHIAGRRRIRDEPFRGSGAVWNPEGEMVKKRKNKDYFMNYKAQSYWALRLRFEATYKAVVDKIADVDLDTIISIDPNLPELNQLTMELSQPTYALNTIGKIVIDKAPDGTRSPNHADAVMICYQPAGHALDTWEQLGRD